MRTRRSRSILQAVVLVVCVLTLFVAATASADPGRPPRTRKTPYLIYPNDNTTTQVLWQAENTKTCTIERGLDTSYSLGSVETTEYGDDHQHTHTITGLAPGTKYYYRVTVDNEEHPGSFYAALPTDATAVKFLAYGDTRTYPNDHDQVAEGMISTFTADPDFQSIVIMAGDFVSDGEKENDWDDEFFDPDYDNIQAFLRNVPYLACIGNHEGNGNLYMKYFPYLFLGGRYWSFDYGPAHVVVVDQYTSYAPGSAQLEWIEDDLAATTKPWKFIVLHEPGWSAGGHSNSYYVQSRIHPLCIEYDVAIVFGGHNHYYARAVVDDIQHVTTGGGGAALYDPIPSYPYVVASAKKHHYCTIEIDGGVLDFQALEPDGTLIDSFQLLIDTSVAKGEEVLDSVASLAATHPNPMTSSTLVSFSMAEASDVTLSVYNARGQRVTTLMDERMDPGRHNVTWKGDDSAGRPVSSGIYFVQLEGEGFTDARKAVVIR